jgi:hypothetical protein
MKRDNVLGLPVDPGDIVRLVVRHPLTGAPLAGLIEFDVLRPGSEILRLTAVAMHTAMAQQFDDLSKLSEDQNMAAALTMASNVIISWHGSFLAAIPFTPEVARALLMNLPFLSGQVLEAAGLNFSDPAQAALLAMPAEPERH